MKLFRTSLLLTGSAIARDPYKSPINPGRASLGSWFVANRVQTGYNLHYVHHFPPCFSSPETPGLRWMRPLVILQPLQSTQRCKPLVASHVHPFFWGCMAPSIFLFFPVPQIKIFWIFIWVESSKTSGGIFGAWYIYIYIDIYRYIYAWYISLIYMPDIYAWIEACNPSLVDRVDYPVHRSGDGRCHPMPK